MEMRISPEDKVQIDVNIQSRKGRVLRIEAVSAGPWPGDWADVLLDGEGVPRKLPVWMLDRIEPVMVTLREKRRGVVKTVEMECGRDLDDDTVVSMWTDGNYECDCNRSIFLYGLNVDTPRIYKCNRSDASRRIELLKIQRGDRVIWEKSG